ncbi:MAG: aspartate-alanine antiporter [Muribaculaceae bacterium]|nr:aspartate-alanine antiporter [Muribaculaceae bacterium]
MDWLITVFQKNPVSPIFLTLGLGFWLGKLKYKSFSLGAVSATLIVGVLFGQMNIEIPQILKTVFFLLFLFSIGYSVGPQFFRSFKGSGIRQMVFAVVLALICAGTVILTAKLMGYSTGIAAGLYAGSQTASASLGLLGDTVREMPMDEAQRDYMLKIIPACYAVTYVLGAVGSAWFLSNIGPMLMGGINKVREDVARIEQDMDSGETMPEPGQIHAARPVAFRAYKATCDYFVTPKTVAQLEEVFHRHDLRVFVERLRVKGEIIDPHPDQLIYKGDTVVLGARTEEIIDVNNYLGPEVTDMELLNFGAERTPVTVASKGAAGMTLGELRRQPYMRGVVVASLKRNNMSIPAKNKTELQRGDVITLVGLPRAVTDAAVEIGYADRQTDATDMVFVGLGIAAGCIIGALSIKIKGIPLSLSMSAGALISGLVLGWVRTRKPSFGRIPSPVVWIFNNLGLNMFIAVIGITAGASFLHGIREAGFLIFFIGFACTLITLTLGIIIGRKIFKFSTPETLGCVAGARCAVAAIGAVQDTLQSDVPNLGYTVTYAVANIALVFSSLLVLFIV